MARQARGAENLEWAREVLARVQTLEQLRQAQAVVLPLDYGLTLPPRHNSCRLLRTNNPEGGDEGHQWHDTDNHSKTRQ
jgi:hypothetical protein